MPINVGKDTNVIVFFGDGAIEMFAPLVERWSQILLPGQWRGFQFYLVGSKAPDSVTLARLDTNLVNDKNTEFYIFTEENPPTGDDFYNAIGDKIGATDRVRFQLICDSAGKDLDYEWAAGMIGAAGDIGSLTFEYTYYLVIGRNREPAERDGMLRLVNAKKGTTILIGEENSHGGRVSPEIRLNAIILGVLFHSIGELALQRDTVYSFGYSALNANGSELKRMRERTVCRALIDIFANPITSPAELNQTLQILPEEVSSIMEIRSWLENYTRQHLKKPAASAMKNAWITIRFDSEMSPNDAVRRMRRFVDLNYTAEQAIREEAKELAWRTENAVRERLRRSILTAFLSEKVMEEIAEAFHKLSKIEVLLHGCTYPPKTLKQRLGAGREEYLAECKKAVWKSIEAYMVEKNISIYASEMEACYRKLKDWLQRAQDNNGYDQSGAAVRLLQEVQNELNSNDAGDLLRLENKYDDYAEALGRLNLNLGDLTRNVDRVFYQKDGTLTESEWRSFISEAGLNVEIKMPPEFRGEFFHVLNAELSTQKEREDFFDQYLYMGTRMYYSLKTSSTSGISYYLADQRLTDHWFSEKEHIYKARTDNAENLTVYLIGNLSPQECLSDESAYFKGNRRKTDPAHRLFSSETFGSQEKKRHELPRTPRHVLFGGDRSGSAPAPGSENNPVAAEKTERQVQIMLKPDDRNEYRLYWDWNGNDQTAMVEIRQYGEKVGKTAVIPVQQFKENGNNMNVTYSIMAGKPIPAGMLSVTIRDQNMKVLMEDIEVPGRREIVRFRVNGNGLELKPFNRSAVEKLVLRTTDLDGTITYFPLYPALEGEQWIYRGMKITDGAVVEDPTQANGEIIPIDMGK